MPDSYSLYDAKAKLSALVRQVRDGARVVITVHGKPAAELRPIEPADESLDDRLARLEAQGILLRPSGTPAELAASPPGPHRPGALQRFLDERD